MRPSAGPAQAIQTPRWGSVALVAAALLASTAFAPTAASAAPAVDVPASSTHAVSIERLLEAEVMRGYPGGEFRPAITLTRGQLATLVAGSLGLPAATTSDAFSDIAGSTHVGAIQALADAGAISGFADGTFRPSAPVTRAQAASMLGRALEAASADAPDPDDSWFSDTGGTTHQAAIDRLAAIGVLRGDAEGRFLPTSTIRRDQAASILARVIDRTVVDTTFGEQGSVVTTVRANNQARGITTGADGELFSVGHAWTDDSFDDFANHLIRHLPDGSVDASFGTDGRVTLDGPAPAFWEFLQPVVFEDGSIAVVGNAMTQSAVAFVSADGALDNDRGHDGYVHLEATDADDPGFMAFGAAADADGGLIVVGDRFSMLEEGGIDPDSRLAFVLRLAADGSLDTSFGEDGIATLDAADGRIQLRDVSISSDGSIVVTGRVLSSPEPQLLLASLTADGQLDSSFGQDGFARPAPDATTARIGWRLSHDASGAIIVIGNQGPFRERDGFIVRTDADGNLDTGFGSAGLRVLPDGFVTDLHLTDTHVWVGGQAGDIGADRGWSIWGLTFDGTADRSFGLGGQSVLTFPDPDTRVAVGGNVAGMAARGDGTLVLHGVDASGSQRLVGLVP